MKPQLYISHTEDTTYIVFITKEKQWGIYHANNQNNDCRKVHDFEKFWLFKIVAYLMKEFNTKFS